MTSLEIFENLNEELSQELNGILNNYGDVIKWEYDGINERYTTDNFESYLEEIAEEDKILIDEFLEDIDAEDFFTTIPEIDDSFVYFYIEK